MRSAIIPGRSAFQDQAKAAIEAAGLTVLDKGWPDFAVADRHDLCALLEIKTKRDRLSPVQETMHRALYALNVRVQIVRPWELDACVARLAKEKLERDEARAILRRWTTNDARNAARNAALTAPRTEG